MSRFAAAANDETPVHAVASIRVELGQRTPALLGAILQLPGRNGQKKELIRDPLPAHTVRSATVGGSRDARTAGMRPANAPIRMAEAMPPDHASTGMTMAQCLVLA